MNVSDQTVSNNDIEAGSRVGIQETIQSDDSGNAETGQRSDDDWLHGKRAQNVNSTNIEDMGCLEKFTLAEGGLEEVSYSEAVDRYTSHFEGRQ